MRRVITNLLINVSPATLKRYGLYAILSFFISISVIIGIDDIRVRNTDIRYERTNNEYLRNVLKEQQQLRLEQENLLKSTDTFKYERH